MVASRTDGDRLKALLRAQGRSSTWLAGQIGIHKSQMSRAIKGEASRDLSQGQQAEVARILGVPREMIFSDG